VVVTVTAPQSIPAIAPAKSEPDAEKVAALLAS